MSGLVRDMQGNPAKFCIFWTFFFGLWFVFIMSIANNLRVLDRYSVNVSSLINMKVQNVNRAQSLHYGLYIW